MEGDWHEMISLARGVSADARGIADEARREYARAQDDLVVAAPEAPPSAPADETPLARPDGDAFPLRLLWLAGLASAVVGFGAGMYWMSSHRA